MDQRGGYTQNHEGGPLVACESTPAADATADFTPRACPASATTLWFPPDSSPPGEPVWNGTQVTVVFTAEEGTPSRAAPEDQTVKSRRWTSTPVGRPRRPRTPATRMTTTRTAGAPAASSAPKAAPLPQPSTQAPASAPTAKGPPASGQERLRRPQGGSGRPDRHRRQGRQPRPAIGAASASPSAWYRLVAWRRQQLTELKRRRREAEGSVHNTHARDGTPPQPLPPAGNMLTDCRQSSLYQRTPALSDMYYL